MRIVDCEQRSEEWFRARTGVVTASAAHDLQPSYVAKKKAFLYKIVAEKLTGICNKITPNDAMQWGIDKEDEAREWYENKTGNKVDEVGFIYMDDSERVGCSPDGLVGDDGLIEIKCPNSVNHLSQMAEGAKLEYRRQMDFQMMVTGRKWCDFVVYDPRFPPPFNGKIIRYHRDEKKIAELRKLTSAFNNQVDGFIEKLRQENTGG